MPITADEIVCAFRDYQASIQNFYELAQQLAPVLPISKITSESLDRQMEIIHALKAYLYNCYFLKLEEEKKIVPMSSSAGTYAFKNFNLVEKINYIQQGLSQARSDMIFPPGFPLAFELTKDFGNLFQACFSLKKLLSCDDSVIYRGQLVSKIQDIDTSFVRVAQMLQMNISSLQQGLALRNLPMIFEYFNNISQKELSILEKKLKR